MMMKIPLMDRIDFYDHEKLEKLQESRARKWLKLFLKAKQGDPGAVEAIKKHEAEDREIKRRANETGYYWV
jgi:hypothetical protein